MFSFCLTLYNPKQPKGLLCCTGGSPTLQVLLLGFWQGGFFYIHNDCSEAG